MSKYFGTDGFRGEANKDLLNKHAYRIGRFLGRYFTDSNRPARILIGKDTRRSSYMLEYAMIAGISTSGGEPHMMHVTTTPSVAYITKTDGFDCGVMISASHNPYYDNGIKLFNSSGEKVTGELIGKIEEYLDDETEKSNDSLGGTAPFAHREKIGKVEDYFSGRNRYMAYLLSVARNSFKGLSVGLDPANGAAYMISRGVFEALGAKVHMINNAPNGLNINDGCGSTHIEGLQKFVKEKRLDVGFAFDGDADRCLTVDENGKVVDGDGTLYLAAKYYKVMGELKSNTVVTTVMSNLGLNKAFDSLGINYITTPVGDKYVYEKMVESGFELGGEPSGHTIFLKHSTTGDGILTAIKLADLIVSQKAPLSALIKPLELYPQIIKSVRVKNKANAKNDNDVVSAVKAAEEKLEGFGRVLMRESGTESKLRIMVEARDEKLCASLINSIYDVLDKKGHLE